MKTSTVVVSTTYTTTFVVSLYLGVLRKIWAMVNEMQLLAYIFYMNLYLPANAYAFFDFLIRISEFTLFDTSYYNEALMDKLYQAYKRLFGQSASRRRMRGRKRSKTRSSKSGA